MFTKTNNFYITIYMAKKLTTEQAKTKLREIYGNDYDY